MTNNKIFDFTFETFYGLTSLRSRGRPHANIHLQA